MPDHIRSRLCLLVAFFISVYLVRPYHLYYYGNSRIVLSPRGPQPLSVTCSVFEAVSGALVPFPTTHPPVGSKNKESLFVWATWRPGLAWNVLARIVSLFWHLSHSDWSTVYRYKNC